MRGDDNDPDFLTDAAARRTGEKSQDAKDEELDDDEDDDDPLWTEVQELCGRFDQESTVQVMTKIFDVFKPGTN